MSQKPPIDDGNRQIQFHLNDTVFQISQADLREVMGYAIPPYMRDSKMEAPDATSDLIRGAVKTAASLSLNKLLFQVYGANAPKVAKRADKLPFVWNAIIDFLLKKLQQYQVQIYVQENQQGAYQVVGSTAIPIPEIASGSVEGLVIDADTATPTEATTGD